MKKGKIILSAASLVVTVAGIFAFKGASKFNGGAQCYTHTGANYEIKPGCHALGSETQEHNCGSATFYKSLGGGSYAVTLCTTAS
jgi:hypothetical protein